MQQPMTASQMITRAKTRLVLDHPFFGSIAMRLDYVEVPNHPTCFTNGRIMGYNPDFIQSCTLDEVTGIIAHEVMHLAMKHHLRRQERDPMTWNQACDFTINDILKEAGFILPKDALYDATYAEQAAERIYATLIKTKQQDQNTGGGQNQQQSDDQNQQQSGGQGQQPSQQSSGGQGQPQPQPQPGWGEVQDALDKDATEEEQQQAEEDWDLTVANAYQAAKSIGNVPGNIAQMVEAAKKSKTDWREVLRDFMEKTVCRDDYTWMTPNRRYGESSFVLPSLADGEEIPQIVVGVDTSGSVSAKELEQYAAEIASILEDFQCTFKVIYCDTRVRHVQDLTYEELPFKLEARGGGGTQLAPIFDYIDENHIEAQAVIVFSDMYCSNFGKSDIPTIWLNTGGKGGRDYADRYLQHGTIVDLELSN